MLKNSVEKSGFALMNAKKPVNANGSNRINPKMRQANNEDSNE